MDLSNLRPADGSKHSDNFRRGRGHGSGNGKTAGKGHKDWMRWCSSTGGIWCCSPPWIRFGRKRLEI